MFDEGIFEVSHELRMKMSLIEKEFQVVLSQEARKTQVGCHQKGHELGLSLAFY